MPGPKDPLIYPPGVSPGWDASHHGSVCWASEEPYPTGPGMDFSLATDYFGTAVEL